MPYGTSLEAQQAAEAMGHDPQPDHASIERWTCSRRWCGRAVLRHPATGNIYGSATTDVCPPPPSG